jgi:hypothetical protein
MCGQWYQFVDDRPSIRARVSSFDLGPWISHLQPMECSVARGRLTNEVCSLIPQENNGGTNFYGEKGQQVVNHPMFRR